MHYFRTVFVTGVMGILAHSCIAGYSPTRTEINLGAVPLDDYNSSATNGSLGNILNTCPSSYTIRNCYKLYFNNNSATSPYTSDNYVAQGVTGVRFQFGTGPYSSGGNVSHSTAWDSRGNVSSTWLYNLNTFLSDLHSYGIVRVTPTPGLDGFASSPIIPATPIYDCTGTTPLVFYPALPWGNVGAGAGPDCFEVNDGYSAASANPYFWGWTPLFNLVDGIFGAINSSGLQLAEFDLYNEMDLLNWTVLGRLFYDNTTPMGGSTDVLGTLRSHATSYSLDPYAITVSTMSFQSSSSGYHCGSVYGDSAILLRQSEVLAGIGGGLIGFPDIGSGTNNLACGGTVGTMISLPVSYSQPDVTDVHVYACVTDASDACTTADATANATTTYSDLYAFLYYRSLTGSTAMIGETASNQNCGGFTTTMASENVSGYLASDLYTYHSSGTVLRPWNRAGDPDNCLAMPTTINPPYTP